MGSEIKRLASVPWRRRVLKHSLEAVILLEFTLSVIFFVLSYIRNNIYFKGVAVGLLISWVTSTIVLLFKKNSK